MFLTQPSCDEHQWRRRQMMLRWVCQRLTEDDHWGHQLAQMRPLAAADLQPMPPPGLAEWRAVVQPLLAVFAKPLLLLGLPYVLLRLKTGARPGAARYLCAFFVETLKLASESFSGWLSVTLCTLSLCDSTLRQLRASKLAHDRMTALQRDRQRAAASAKLLDDVWEGVFLRDAQFLADYGVDPDSGACEFFKEVADMSAVMLRAEFVWSAIAGDSVHLEGLRAGDGDTGAPMPPRLVIDCLCVLGGPVGKSRMLRAVQDCVARALSTGYSCCTRRCRLPFLHEIVSERFDPGNRSVCLDVLQAEALISRLDALRDANRRALVLVDDVFPSASSSEFAYLCVRLCDNIRRAGHVLMMTSSRRDLADAAAETMAASGIRLEVLVAPDKLVGYSREHLDADPVTGMMRQAQHMQCLDEAQRNRIVEFLGRV